MYAEDNIAFCVGTIITFCVGTMIITFCVGTMIITFCVIDRHWMESSLLV